MNTSTLTLWTQALTDLFVLNACLSCQTPLVRQESHICLDCMGQLPLTSFAQNPQNNDMYKRLAGRVPLSAAYSMAWFDKGGILQHLLEALKYANQPEIGRFLGRQYGRTLLKHGHQLEGFSMVPVPLHPRKLRKRGYNQAEQICLGLQEIFPLQIKTDLLIRTRFTRTQTRMSGFRRQKNTKGAFELQGDIPPKLLLVDDILTTGATISACCQPIIDHTDGLPELRVLTIGVATA